MVEMILACSLVESELYSVIIIVGFLSLFHAAFSAAQHRSYLRITSQEFTTLPIDIIVQAVLSLFAIIWGVMNTSGSFREIPAAAELNKISWETQVNLPSFYIFNHRGKALSEKYFEAYTSKMIGKGDLETHD